MLATRMTASAAARSGAQHWERALLRRHGDREIVDLGERLGHDGVIGPATLAPVLDQTRVLEDLEVERELRLRGVEIFLQVADAPLAASQQLHDGESDWIGQCVEERYRTVDVEGVTSGHEWILNNFS